MSPEHFERMLGGPEADAFAVAGELELLDLGVFAVGEADVDEADGLVRVGAGGGGGAGEAGDGDAERSCLWCGGCLRRGRGLLRH